MLCKYKLCGEYKSFSQFCYFIKVVQKNLGHNLSFFNNLKIKKEQRERKVFCQKIIEFSFKCVLNVGTTSTS